MTDFHTYHLNLLKLTYNNLLNQPPFNTQELNTPDSEFLQQLGALVEGFAAHEAWVYDEGPALMTRLVRAYPQLVHLAARDLFWLFGGDCLHHMPDDELALFAELDEARAEAERRGEAFDYLAERTRIFNLS